MNCEVVRERLRSGEPLNDAELRHSADCNVCAELVGDEPRLGRALRHAPPPLDLGADLEQGLQAVHEKLAHEPALLGAVRSQPRVLRVAALVSFALIITYLEVTYLKRPDLRLLPPRALVGFTLLTVPTLLAGVWLALRPLWRAAVPTWVHSTVAAAALFVPVALSWAPLRTGHPLGLRGAGHELLPWALSCFVHGAVVAALFIAVVALLDRGGRRSVLPLAAALAGLFASFALSLHCPVTQVGHLLLGHASVGLVALALITLHVALRERHSR
jgi:hypothetical protein